MKKRLSVLAVVLTLAMMISCALPVFAQISPANAANGVLSERSDLKKPTADAEEENENEDVSIDGYIFTDEYDSTYGIMIVTNNTDVPLNIHVDGIAVNDAGEELDTDYFEIDVLAPGEAGLGYFYWYDLEGVSDVQYNLEYEEEDWYLPIVSELDFEATIIGNKVIVRAENNTESVADSVMAYAVFTDAEGNIVGFDSEYIGDHDGELKPGSVLYEEVYNYEDFEDAYMFYSAYTRGEAADYSDYVNSDLFTIEDYLYIMDDETWEVYVAMQNNSDETVAVWGIGIVSNEEGTVVGADNAYLDVIGPGETSIAYFYFDDLIDPYSYNFAMDFVKEDYYIPVVGNLEIAAERTDRGYALEVTNNGDTAAKFADVYVLFFDDDGNLVDVSDTYIKDADYEIKPGATESGEVRCYSEFTDARAFIVASAY